MVDTLFETEKTNKEEKFCVYMHINKINGKRYIGQTIRQDNINYRWNYGEGYKKCPHFYRAIQKYGWDNFEHYIIQKNLTKEEANKLEELNILAYNTTNPDFGYNLQSGGSHYSISDEVRQKFSNAKKGENHPMYGKHHTEIAKQRMSASRKGKKISDEHKRKITIAVNNMSDITKQKMSEAKKGEKHPMYGKHHTEETKQKMNNAKKDIHWINKDNVSKMVKENELHSYLNDGWLLGRGHYDRNKSNNNSPKVN